MCSNEPVDIYRYMIESSRDIIFLLDNCDRFVFLNDQVEALIGFAKQELIGQHFSRLVCPADLDQAKLNFPDCRKSAEKELTRSVELRFRNKLDHGNHRFFDIKVINVPDDISKAYGDIVFGDNKDNRQITSYGVARDITQLKILDNIVNTNANYDYLTGLPNRVLLKDRMKLAMAHAKRNDGKFVVMFIDLDGFKLVNDIYGHSAGDILLQTVSARLQACLREADTLARVGGDEFVLLLPDIHEEEEAKKIADKLLNEINRPFVISRHRMPVSASIGVALYPDNGELLDDLIRGADRAMYHVKHRSKNGYAFLSDLPEVNRQKNIFNFI